VRLLRGLGALILLAASSACVADRAYRGADRPNGLPNSVLNEQLQTRQFDPTQSEDPKVLEKPWPYRLTFIEFSDRGEMFDARQLDRALEEIAAAKRDAAARSSAARTLRPVVAVFVHGWKNNASDSSGNVWGFRQVLAGLSLQYSPAPIVGVYIGWRGATVSAPFLEEFTFFDRHRRSQSVAVPQMPDAFRRVMQAAKGPTYEDRSTVSVLVGHSFGGAVLETALTQGLSDEVVTARQQQRPIRWPADLIVLLNEAQEAERSYPFIDTLVANVTARPPCAAPGEERETLRPAVISISSTGDYATRAFFPAAQLLTRLFHRPSYHGPDPMGVGSATSLYFSTTAHTGALRSHLLGRADDPQILDALKQCNPAVDTTLFDNTANIHYYIVERPASKNRTPYWVMHMPPSIVPDHSTIFTPVFRQFLVTLIAQALEIGPHDRVLAPAAP